MLSSLLAGKVISIHAPSRERQTLYKRDLQLFIFQSTLPRGSDSSRSYRPFRSGNFNPRSLAGATKGWVYRTRAEAISIHAPSRERRLAQSFWHSQNLFQSTLPRGSDRAAGRRKQAAYISIHAPSRERQHQNKLLLYSFKSSIFCELAQLKYSKIYFDVRKLIVSHSSLSCEPKLNFMFHITSHRIILHYFYSCQSICK